MNLPGRSNQQLQDELDEDIDYIFSVQPQQNSRISVNGNKNITRCNQLIDIGILERSNYHPFDIQHKYYNWTVEGWRYAKSRNELPSAFQGIE